jgi:hypothetical protein
MLIHKNNTTTTAVRLNKHYQDLYNLTKQHNINFKSSLECFICSNIDSDFVYNNKDYNKDNQKIVGISLGKEFIDLLKEKEKPLTDAVKSFLDFFEASLGSSLH